MDRATVGYQFQCLIQAQNRRSRRAGIGVHTGAGHIDICAICSSNIQREYAYQQKHSYQYE